MQLKIIFTLRHQREGRNEQLELLRLLQLPVRQVNLVALTRTQPPLGSLSRELQDVIRLFCPKKVTQILKFQEKRNAAYVTNSHHQRSRNVHPSFSQSGASVMPVIPGYT